MSDFQNGVIFGIAICVKVAGECLKAYNEAQNKPIPTIIRPAKLIPILKPANVKME